MKTVGYALMMSLALAGSALAAPSVTLKKVASFKHQVTGVTVTPDGRVFVNFPRWTEDSPVSVAEVKNGVATAYPDEGWNSWRNAKDDVTPKDHFVCVQSVVADGRGSLWVLDPAAPAMGAIVKDGPKLVQIDLATNKVVRTIAFPETVALTASYLNDVRFAPDGTRAYITDSGAKGAIIVVDLKAGTSKRVLDGDPSTQPEKTVTVTADGKPLRRPDGRGINFAADGIALSNDGKTLYWQAIRGKTLYSAPTAALATGTAKATVVGENGVADGLWLGKDGKLYITAPETNSILVRDLAVGGSTPATLVTDKRLRWPDTISEGPDGTLYVTTSHIQDSSSYKPKAPIALPTELWTITLPATTPPPAPTK